MKINRTLTAVLLVAAIVAIHARVARADFDVWGKTTKVTFASDVQVPGTILPAGTYIFKLFDSPNDRHIVQVYNADQTKLITMVVAVPDYKLDVSGRTVFNFEGGRSEPVAVESWFYPGDTGPTLRLLESTRGRVRGRTECQHPPLVATASEPPAPLASPAPLVEDATTQPAPIAEPPAVSEPSTAVTRSRRTPRNPRIPLRKPAPNSCRAPPATSR